MIELSIEAERVQISRQSCSGVSDQRHGHLPLPQQVQDWLVDHTRRSRPPCDCPSGIRIGKVCLQAIGDLIPPILVRNAASYREG